MVEFILYVSNQERSKSFYRIILQKEPILDVPGMTEFVLGRGCKLGIMPENGIARILGEKVPHPEKGRNIPRCELYLNVRDIEKRYKVAIQAGAVAISPVSPRDWGDMVGYVSDLDGHIIAFAEKLKK